MMKMEELERLDINMLAMYCLRVVETAAENSMISERARKLKTEWALLIGNPNPPVPELAFYPDREAYLKVLKQRMVRVLAECSERLFLTGKKAATDSYSKANCAMAG